MVLLALSFSAPPLAVGVRSYRPRLRAWKRGRDHDRSRKFSFCSRLIPSLPRTNDFAAILLSSAPRSQSESHRSLVESPVVTFQQAIQRLQDYWASVGCAIMQCSNTEVGAGTMNPSTFLRVLGPEPWNVAYVEPSVRPDDSRYGDNPNRLQRHTQFQVILKPDPGNSQELFIRSLLALGIDVDKHDIRFVEDNWESPVLGAWGLGWEIWMDGMEITQFTYFQQAGSLPLLPISVEITYGLERILMLLQGVNHFKKIQYADGITYGELFLENEREMSAYYLEHANISHIQQCFENFEDEALSLLALELPIPAYDQLLKASHAFNILDARGFVGVTERARYFARMRSLARQCAQLWLKTREALGHPLGFSKENDLFSHSAILEPNQEKVLERPGAFVLEIGTEEMPPHDVVEASNQLRSLTVEYLKKRRLSCGEVSSYGTPRRLVVFTESLSHMQAENEIEVRGPPAARAFDSEGTPTQAAKGFCRKNGITLDDLYKKFEGKTEYVYARIKESKQSTFEVLVDGLPSILALISFPKSMRWNSQVIMCMVLAPTCADLEAIVTDLNTNVHIMKVTAKEFRRMQDVRKRKSSLESGSKLVVVLNQIETAEAYLHKMREAGILVNMKERKEKIICDADSLASSVNSNAIMQDSLVEEVVNLVEAPLAILGRFDEYFLEIPKDILIMVMQKHQKYFPLICQHTGTLMPYFIAVANGLIDEQVVRKGNEAVLRARYEDASFFYKMDTQKKFSEFRGLLSGILFHEQLGTMLDKVVRIQKIVGKLSHSLGNEKSVHTIVEDAAALAMSDLATSIVTEFTSLSGIMARHYALRDGYPEQIAEALFEITLPRFSGDILPKSDAGIVLAIADRLDSLVGLFGSGCQPSSTNDPFGLRRVSYGLVQILVENNKDLSLKEALTLVADVQPIEISASVIDDVTKFVTRRLEQLLVDKGISPEIVRAVLSERANWPCLAARSAIEMETLSRSEMFSKVIQAYSRPTRIIRGKKIGSNIEVTEAAFEKSEEEALWNAYMKVASKIHHGVSMDSFFEASLVLLRPLEDFFNNVFVMAEDEKIKNNRLAILKRIAELPNGIADLSVLPGF
ncbi:hypothetical protein ZIOFF_056756 [Zingiber officinale]|uniref:glycine--tRNA ligase n=1 Tax=Zingiber officinale TaxID=94328 RepID=A0A8J5KL60_ZINOF|nr:hypothetical protein ZIOFF_056756 [Zingiber officinale]